MLYLTSPNAFDYKIQFLVAFNLGWIFFGNTSLKAGQQLPRMRLGKNNDWPILKTSCSDFTAEDKMFSAHAGD